MRALGRACFQALRTQRAPWPQQLRELNGLESHRQRAPRRLRALLCSSRNENGNKNSPEITRRTASGACQAASGML